MDSKQEEKDAETSYSITGHKRKATNQCVTQTNQPKQPSPKRLKLNWCNVLIQPKSSTNTNKKSQHCELKIHFPLRHNN